VSTYQSCEGIQRAEAAVGYQWRQPYSYRRPTRTRVYKVQTSPLPPGHGVAVGKSRTGEHGKRGMGKQAIV